MSRSTLPYLLSGLLVLLLIGCAGEEQSRALSDSAETLPLLSADTTTPDTTSQELRPTHTAAVGDVDGDNKLDSATVIGPKSDVESMECEGSCITRIMFSSPSIPILIDSLSIGGIVAGVGDVDGNGTDDLLFLPDWFTSCWIDMTLYGLQENEWRVLGGGSYYRCNDDPYNPDSLAQRVRNIEPGVFELLQDTLDLEGEAGIVRAPVRFDIRDRLPSQ